MKKALTLVAVLVLVLPTPAEAKMKAVRAYDPDDVSTASRIDISKHLIRRVRSGQPYFNWEISSYERWDFVGTLNPYDGDTSLQIEIDNNASNPGTDARIQVTADHMPGDDRNWYCFWDITHVITQESGQRGTRCLQNSPSGMWLAVPALSLTPDGTKVTAFRWRVVSRTIGAGETDRTRWRTSVGEPRGDLN